MDLNENYTERFNFGNFQSPPWAFVERNDDNSTENYFEDFSGNETESTFTVSGRDHTLLKILAAKMNFRFTYVDVLKAFAPVNDTQIPGELGLQMIQNRVREKKTSKLIESI